MFARRVEILDFWHAAEHAWGFARKRFGEGTKQAAAFARHRVHALRRGEVKAVIADLEAMLVSERQVLSTACVEALEKLIQYYRTHEHRMDYPRYRAMGYRIGSGAVESAHKQIVHARLRGPGMRWSEKGAQNMLALRHYMLLDIFHRVEQSLRPAA